MSGPGTIVTSTEPRTNGRSDETEGTAARSSIFRSGGSPLKCGYTYGGDLVSTWSVLRQSCKPRSPVGLVNPPANKASAKNNLALAA
jgi:hypothetical protein